MQAYKNKRKTWLSEEVLNAVGGDPEVVGHVKLSTIEIIKRFFSKFSGDRIAPLFATRRIGTMSMFNSHSYPSLYKLAHSRPRLTTIRSITGLVLLGNDRHGIPPLQCFPSTVSPERWEEYSTYAQQYCVSELRHHLNRWGSRIFACCLYCRRQIHWSKVHHCNLDTDYWHPSIHVHAQL